jgi:hypothetical protein
MRRSARSLQDLVPADNALPMDAALAWTRHDGKREEAEQQRRLLDLAATRCRGRTTPVKAKKKMLAPRQLAY